MAHGLRRVGPGARNAGCVRSAPQGLAREDSTATSMSRAVMSPKVIARRNRIFPKGYPWLDDAFI